MAAITAELQLEVSKFQQALRQAQTQLRGFKGTAEKEGKGLGSSLFGELGSQVAGLATVGGITALAASVKGIMSDFDDLADTALRLNESTETLQRVGGAAELSGTSVEGLANAFIKLERNIGDVENSKAREALERYGLTAEKLAAMPLDQKILALSEAFQKARTEGTGLADLQALLGRGGAELIPLLSASREEIEKLFASVNVVSDDSVQRIAAMNDEFDSLVMNAKAFAAEVIVANVGLAKIAGRLLKGEAFGNILTDMGNEGLDADIERAAKERGRKKAADALKQAEAEKAAAAAAKERQKAEDKINEQRRNNARMRGDISQGELDVLPDEQKFQALQDKLREVFIDAQISSGKNIQPTIEGLKKLADEQRTAGNFRGEGATLERLKEAQRMQHELDQLSAKMRESGASAAADAAAKAERDTKKSKPLPDVPQYRTAGSLAGAVNLIMGRSANELILDESKKQTGELQQIKRTLEQIRDKPATASPNRVTAAAMPVDTTARFG